MLWKGGRIGGQSECPFGRPGHRPVVAMLPRHVQECRNDDVRPVPPIGPDEPLDDALLAPAPERIVPVLGEAEIMHRVVWSVTEPCHIGIHAAGSLFHLGGPEHAEGTSPLRPEGILTALAARGAGDHDAHAIGKPQSREHVVDLVIRVGPGIHDGDGGFQSAQGAMQADQGWLMDGLSKTAMVIQQEISPRSIDPGGQRERCRAEASSRPGAAGRRRQEQR
jgi:hypothetical protein